MIPVITVIIILSVSVLVTKIATIALMHTGLSRQSAKFQARSAFTGVGYATQEAENIVNHPVRRRIIMLLMLLGNAGIVSVIASLMLTFLDDKDPFGLSVTYRLLLLIAGILLLIILFNSKVVNKGLSKIIHYALKKYTKLNVMDYSGILHLSGEYEIAEILVGTDDWLANKNLAELALLREGLFILGINRKNGTYIGIPGSDTEISPGDTLIIYGRGPTIRRLDTRKKGSRGNFDRRLSERENKKVKIQEKEQDKGSAEKTEDN